MRILLINNGIDINASLEEKYNFVIGIASGESKFDKIVKWLDAHTVKNSG